MGNKLFITCIFLFCFYKLQAQEETVISMTTAMEIDKEIKFRIESEKWVSDTITILDCTKNAIANMDLSNNLFIYSPKEDSRTVVKMPDRRKSEFARRKDRLSSKYYRRKEKRDYFGFILLGGGYTAMPFTQRDNRSHYQSMWHLNAGIIFNPEVIGIKPFHDTLLSGFTIGIAFSMGTYPFCLID